MRERPNKVEVTYDRPWFWAWWKVILAAAEEAVEEEDDGKGCKPGG